MSRGVASCSLSSTDTSSVLAAQLPRLLRPPASAAPLASLSRRDWRRDTSRPNKDVPKNPSVSGSVAGEARPGLSRAEAPRLWVSPSLRSLSPSSICCLSRRPAESSLVAAEWGNM